MATVLTAIELTKRFGDVTAVDGLSFDLEAGSVTGFLGPHGAGKTTTLRMLLGRARPSNGRALRVSSEPAENPLLLASRHARTPLLDLGLVGASGFGLFGFGGTLSPRLALQLLSFCFIFDGFSIHAQSPTSALHWTPAAVLELCRCSGRRRFIAHRLGVPAKDAENLPIPLPAER